MPNSTQHNYSTNVRGVDDNSGSMTDEQKAELGRQVKKIYTSAMEQVRALEGQKEKIVRDYIRQLEQQTIQKIRDQLNTLPDQAKS